jgi:UDP-glucuronate 4-epimerase
MKTILATGSAGFIGFHLIQKLLSDGYKVVGIDNFNDYYDVGLKESRNKILEKNSDFKLYKGNIDDIDFVRSVFKENPDIDAVCHLAAQAGVRHSLKYPYSYLTNLVGFLHILNEAKNFGVKNFVFASSSSVYGNQPTSVFDEDFVTDTPISLYAATKKSNELLAYSYHHLYGMKCVGLRFFTVYGTYGRPDMAIFDFTKSILEDKPITLFNDGLMKRSFTHVNDIVDGIIKSLEIDIQWGVFNLGNDRSFELHYLVKLLEKNIGKKAQKEYLPLQPGDVPETQANITKAKKLLGWKPKVSIENGIKEFVEWYLEYYKKN